MFSLNRCSDRTCREVFYIPIVQQEEGKWNCGPRRNQSVSLSLPPTDESETVSVESVWLSHFSSERSLSGVSFEAPPDRTLLYKLYGELQQSFGRPSLAAVSPFPASSSS